MNTVTNYQTLYNLAKMESDIQYLISMKMINFTSGADKYEAHYIANKLNKIIDKNEIVTVNSHSVATSVSDKVNNFLGYKLSTIPSLQTMQENASNNHQALLQLKTDSMQNLSISVSGTAYYWNDDRTCGKYDSENTVDISQLPPGISLIDAIRQAEFIMAEGKLNDDALSKAFHREWSDDDFSDFVGHDLCIVNEDGKVILKASLDNEDLVLHWISPLTAEESIGIMDKINHLSDEASTEASWDNYETAKRIRSKISNLAERLMPQEDIDAFGLGDAINYIRHSSLPSTIASWQSDINLVKEKTKHLERMHTLSYQCNDDAGNIKQYACRSSSVEKVFMSADNFFNKLEKSTDVSFSHVSIKDGYDNTLFHGTINDGVIQWEKPLSPIQLNELKQKYNSFDFSSTPSSMFGQLQSRLTPDEWFEDKDFQFLMKCYFPQTEEKKPSDLFNSITQNIQEYHYQNNTNERNADSLNTKTEITYDNAAETPSGNSTRSFPKPF